MKNYLSSPENVCQSFRIKRKHQWRSLFIICSITIVLVDIFEILITGFLRTLLNHNLFMKEYCLYTTINVAAAIQNCLGKYVIQDSKKSSYMNEDMEKFLFQRSSKV